MKGNVFKFYYRAFHAIRDSTEVDQCDQCYKINRATQHVHS